MVKWAYERAVQESPKETPYFLDSLLQTSQVIKSESLDEYAAIERSKGKYIYLYMQLFHTLIYINRYSYAVGTLCSLRPPRCF